MFDSVLDLPNGAIQQWGQPAEISPMRPRRKPTAFAPFWDLEFLRKQVSSFQPKPQPKPLCPVVC